MSFIEGFDYDGAGDYTLVEQKDKAKSKPISLATAKQKSKSDPIFGSGSEANDNDGFMGRVATPEEAIENDLASRKPRDDIADAEDVTGT